MRTYILNHLLSYAIRFGIWVHKLRYGKKETEEEMRNFD